MEFMLDLAIKQYSDLLQRFSLWLWIGLYYGSLWDLVIAEWFTYWWKRYHIVCCSFWRADWSKGLCRQEVEKYCIQDLELLSYNRWFRCMIANYMDNINIRLVTERHETTRDAQTLFQILLEIVSEPYYITQTCQTTKNLPYIVLLLRSVGSFL